MNILILGAGGQLATYLNKQLASNNSFHINALSHNQFDVTSNLNQQISIFNEIKPDLVINCAAYTQVDTAEKEQEIAKAINGTALINLSKAVNETKAELIHISTDFVFSGNKGTPYHEADSCDPIGVYGRTKRLGEENVIQYCNKYSIFRTSWLYSNSYPSFYKTMIHLAKKMDQIGVVYDQVGTPTSAQFLAQLITHYILQKDKPFNQIYHASNEGVCSWYDFAHMIFKLNNFKTKIRPILSEDYPTLAKRPTYSVLSNKKFSESFDFAIPHWTDALAEVVE